MDDARNVFEIMPERNFVSWTALISGYSQMGMAEEALDCYRLMVNDGFSLNDYTYVAAISACARIGNARYGKAIHGRIYRMEEELGSRVSNSLVNMYGKCGFLNSAVLVFDANLEPDLVSWTSLLSCYCQCGESGEALKIFLRSLKAGVAVNEFSCATVLSACTALENLLVGMQVHPLIIKCGLALDKFVRTGLVNFYAKCGELGLAYQTFLEVDQPELPIWTALIGGCVQQGKGRDAIDLFHRLYYSGLKPNEMTFSSVLGAFADEMDIAVGKKLHSLIIKMGFSSFIFVVNAILDFYSKCGLLEDTLEIFKQMDEHNVISWNSLISGFVSSGHYGEATDLLKDMLSKGFDPNLFTYSIILSICSNVPSIGWGKEVHCRIIKPGFGFNVVVGASLIDMYAKCGKLDEAKKAFDNLTLKNLVCWNTLLMGYAQHGFGKEALEIYSIMQRNGIKPNDITLLGVLSACGHVGLLEEGWSYFNSMTKEQGIAPRTEHVASIVSLFARKGQTNRAYEFIRSSPVEPDKVVWRSLLSGCKAHKDIALARYAAGKILSIDPEDISAHIMLSNIYAEAKMWNELAQIRKRTKEKALKKDTGCSWVELKNKIYYFSASHYNQFEQNNLYKILDGLTSHLFDAGYMPNFF